MDISALRIAAQRFREQLDCHRLCHPAVATLGTELEPLMAKAGRGQIQTPMEWRDIPGAYLFTEEGLQQYPALEHAFAEFRIELTGGESPTLRRLKEKMGEPPKSGTEPV
ncbi:hypothetical protein ACIPL1_19640 [Pseudomonas sp. NPDC090202]|uniref:hypothetical protein n=1 Tax=unclassified Pseudomonas TaxID=196821 RepID=UPI003803ED78